MVSKNLWKLKKKQLRLRCVILALPNPLRMQKKKNCTLFVTQMFYITCWKFHTTFKFELIMLVRLKIEKLKLSDTRVGHSAASSVHFVVSFSYYTPIMHCTVYTILLKHHKATLDFLMKRKTFGPTAQARSEWMSEWIEDFIHFSFIMKIVSMVRNIQK